MADAAVAGWLEEMGLAALIESFEREGVDSEALAALNHAQLKELGVARLGDRAKLMSKVIRRKEIMPAAPAATRTKKKEAAAQSKPSWMQILEERAMVPVGSPPATPDAECADGDAIGGEPERSVQELSPPPPTPRGMAPVVSECSPPPPTPRGVAPTLRMAADKQDGSQAQYNLPRKPQAQGGSPAGPDTTPATVQRTLHAPGATTRAEGGSEGTRLLRELVEAHSPKNALPGSGGHSSRCDSPSASSLEPEEPGNCNADERFSFLQEADSAAIYPDIAGGPEGHRDLNNSCFQVTQWSSCASSDHPHMDSHLACPKPPRAEDEDFSEISKACERDEGIQMSSKMNTVTFSENEDVVSGGSQLQGDQDVVSGGLQLQGDAKKLGGILLDGVQGIPIEARSNLGAFMRFMKSQHHVLAMQAQCCIFLVRYAGVSDVRKARAATVGAIPAVLETIRNCGAHGTETAMVVELAVWALTAICGIRENAEILAQAAGPQLIVQTMMNFLDTPGVLEQGCWLFACLASLSPSLGAHLRSIRAEESIRAAWHAHAQHAGVSTQSNPVKQKQAIRDTWVFGGEGIATGAGKTARKPLGVRTNRSGPILGAQGNLIVDKKPAAEAATHIVSCSLGFNSTTA